MPISRTCLKREPKSKVPNLDVKIKYDIGSFRGYIYLTLYRIESGGKKKKIGGMRLEHISRNTWETHIDQSIPATERRKGYGIYMYSFAADLAAINQMVLRSSDSYSVGAERCWRSSRLRKHYSIKKKGFNYYIKPKKPLSLL